MSGVETFRDLSDHILGSSIAGLRAASGKSPTWSLVLGYELEVRKHAYRYVRSGEHESLDEGLKAAMANPLILQTFFVVPFSLGKTEPADAAEQPRTSLLPNWEREHGKASKTPEGKPICFKYNKKSGCKNKNCRFAHVCQKCFGKHSFTACRLRQKAAELAEGAE